MKKMLLGLMLLVGAVASTPVSAQFIVYPRPVRPCYYVLVPVTSYQLVWTAYGYVYAPVTSYAYQLVCY